MIKFSDLEVLEPMLEVLSKCTFKKSSTVFKLHSVLKTLEPVFQSFYKAKTELAKKYGNPNPENPDVYLLDPNKKDEFIKEFTQFLEETISDHTLEESIKKFTIEDFDGMMIEKNGEKVHFEFNLEFVSAMKILMKDF